MIYINTLNPKNPMLSNDEKSCDEYLENYKNRIDMSMSLQDEEKISARLIVDFLNKGKIMHRLVPLYFTVNTRAGRIDFEDSSYIRKLSNHCIVAVITPENPPTKGLILIGHRITEIHPDSHTTDMKRVYQNLAGFQGIKSLEPASSTQVEDVINSLKSEEGTVTNL